MLTDKRTGYPSKDRPWLKYYSEEAINAELPNCSIYEYMYENNKDYPDDIALIYFGRKIKYGELFEKIDAAAKAFTSLGVKSGDIVTVALPSIPEALYTVYALNKIGAVANMIHPLAGKQELINYLNEVESKVAVLFDGTVEILEEGLRETKVRQAIIATAGESLPFGIKLLYKLKKKAMKFDKNSVYCTWKEFIASGIGEALEIFQKDPETMAIISHTGGTTGEPKGVMCSDNNINSLVWQIGVISHLRQERCLVVLPPFINYSLVDGMLAPLALGIQVILLPKYEPNNFVEYVKKYHPNIISSIPPYWEAILNIKDVEKADFSCLSQIFSGGEAMSVETLNKVNALLLSCGSQRRISSGLGCTEIVSAASFTHEACYYPGSAGLPMPRVNCKIIDPETDEEMQIMKEGEICFSGPTVMMGYYKNETATNTIIRVHSDGERWLHTGDVGYINEDGVIFVTGRIKRIILTKGKDDQVTKLFPDRIEKVLNLHPAVNISCVVGVSDEQRINYPKAIIELRYMHNASDELKNDILLYCKGKLPDYQIPSEIEFCDALPRTERGKVDYRELERMAQ